MESKKYSLNVYLAFIISISFFVYSIWDYYNNDIFSGFGTYLFLLISCIVSLTVSIVLILKQQGKRESWKAFLIVAVGLTASLTFTDFIDKTKFRNYYLPRKISINEMETSKFYKYSEDSSLFIVLKYKEPPAFGSGHNVLGLYSKKNKIIDECFFGEFPLKFVEWKDNRIFLKAIVYGGNETYVKSWVSRNKKISNIELVIETEHKK